MPELDKPISCRDQHALIHTKRDIPASKPFLTTEDPYISTLPTSLVSRIIHIHAKAFLTYPVSFMHRETPSTNTLITVTERIRYARFTPLHYTCIVLTPSIHISRNSIFILFIFLRYLEMKCIRSFKKYRE